MRSGQARGYTPPVVSVIVPVYETRDYVAEALDSVLAQTFEDLEVIVVDDGSTDGGGEIARAYAERDSRVSYIWQENAGLAAARNVGIAAARGEAVAFLDSDDLWLPEKLARQIRLLSENAVVHADAYVLRAGGEVGGERIAAHVEGLDGADALGALLRGNSIAVLTVLAPRSLLLTHGCFDASLRSVEDYDLWLRLAADGVRFTYVAEPLAVYRIRPGSLSADLVRMTETRLRVYEKLAGASSGSRRRAVLAATRRERKLLATALWRRGRSAIIAHGKEAGRADLVRAVRTAPGWWKCWVLAGMLVVQPVLRPAALRAERRARRAAAE